MPAILDRLITQLLEKGHDKQAATAIATAAMIKAGNIDKHGNATVKGIRRGKMTPSQRAKDRASKVSGRPTSQYKYSSKTNRAVLKHGYNKKHRR